MIPSPDQHHEIGVWAATADAKSHNSSRRMTADTKCHPHISLHTDILSIALPWLCSFAKQKYHHRQPCQYDSPPLAIRNTSHSSRWPQSAAASTSASSANYSLNASLGNISSVCVLTVLVSWLSA